MAKGKHAAALFEVIHSGKEKPRPIFSTPRWWSRRAAKKGAATEASQPAAQLRTDPLDPTERAISTPLIDRPSDDPVSLHDEVVAPAEPAPSPAVEAPRAAGVDMLIDKERQQITFKISFTSAIIMSFALVVALTLVYLVGRKTSHGPSLAVASQSSEQLRGKPAHPDVLNVGSRSAPVQTPAQPREPDSGTVSRAPEAEADAAAAANPAAALQRSVNLNYAVIQSYPDEKSATEARDALIKAGVGCTLEQKLRGLNPSWFSVVGTQGFAHVSTEDYKAYIRKLDQISQQFAQSKRSFKAFQPMAYKWDRLASGAPAGVSQQ